MNRSIFLLTTIVGCFSATLVPVGLIPIIVVMSLGSCLLLSGLLSRSPKRVDDGKTQRLPYFDVADSWFLTDDVLTSGVLETSTIR